jgi:hypothetical protein
MARIASRVTPLVRKVDHSADSFLKAHWPGIAAADFFTTEV